MREPDSHGNERIPKVYLIISNIQKRANIRALLQVSAAFGCAKVFVVGQPNFDMTSSGKDLPPSLKPFVENGSFCIERFSSWPICCEHLLANRIRLVGVEIHKDAQPLETFIANNPQDTAFLMGNEGQGLNEKQMNSCDDFVYIPQFGAGTASLNVYVATSIILQRFSQYQRESAAK